MLSACDWEPAARCAKLVGKRIVMMVHAWIDSGGYDIECPCRDTKDRAEGAKKRKGNGGNGKDGKGAGRGGSKC